MRLHDGEVIGDIETPCNAFCKPPLHVDLCYTIEHSPHPDTAQTLLSGFQEGNPLVDVVSVTPAPEAPAFEDNPQFDYVRDRPTDPTKPYLVTWRWRKPLAIAAGVQFHD